MPNTAPEPMVVHVAAGVVVRDGHVLISLRHSDAHQGGLWEFPGGKLEPGEAAEVALVRELEEELGILASDSSPLMQIAHDYKDKSVLLDFRLVEIFEGEPQGREGQRWLWCPLADLPSYQFPEANKPVVARLMEVFEVV